MDTENRVYKPFRLSARLVRSLHFLSASYRDVTMTDIVERGARRECLRLLRKLRHRNKEA